MSQGCATPLQTGQQSKTPKRKGKIKKKKLPPTKIAIDSIKKEKNDENDSENLKENKPNNIIEKTLVKNNNNLNKILTQNLNNDKKNKDENKKDIQDDEEEKIKLSIINMERFKEFKKNRELSKNQEKEKEKKKRKSSTPEPIINNELIINDGSLKPLLDTLIKKGSDVNTLNSYLKKKRRTVQTKN